MIKIWAGSLKTNWPTTKKSAEVNSPWRSSTSSFSSFSRAHGLMPKSSAHCQRAQRDWRSLAMRKFMSQQFAKRRPPAVRSWSPLALCHSGQELRFLSTWRTWIESSLVCTRLPLRRLIIFWSVHQPVLVRQTLRCLPVCSSLVKCGCNTKEDFHLTSSNLRSYT